MPKSIIPRVIETEIKVEDDIYLQVQNLQGNPRRKLIRGIEYSLNTRSEIYQDYCKNNTSLEQVVLVFDRLTIAAECRFPGIDVQIYARELEFTASGCLDLSGEDNTHTPISSSERVGKHGGNSGSLDLWVGKLKLPSTPSSPLIRMDGGGGQKAVAGKDGKSGENGRFHNGDALSKKPYDVIDECVKKWTPAGNHFITSLIETEFWSEAQRERDMPIHRLKISHEGSFSTENWDIQLVTSTHGEDAVAPGKPGDGGNAGRFRSNERVADVSLKKGSAGVPAKDCSGGKAGSPAKSGVYNLRLKTSMWSKIVKNLEWESTHEARNGADAPAPRGKDGKDGSREACSNKDAWLHPALVDAILLYARDKHLAGERRQAGDLLTPLLEHLQNLSPAVEAAEWAGNRFISLTVARQEAARILSRVERGMDYFGNPPGYMPLVSYAGAREFYKRELDGSLFIVLAGAQLAGTLHRAEDRKALLNTVIETKEKRILLAKERMAEAAAELAQLEPKLESVQKEVLKKLGELGGHQDRVLRDARSKASAEAATRAAFRLGAAACMVIPVGQPVLGTVGGGLLSEVADTLVPAAQGQKVDWMAGGKRLVAKYKDAKGMLNERKNMADLHKGLADVTMNIIKNAKEADGSDPEATDKLNKLKADTEAKLKDARDKVKNATKSHLKDGVKTAINAFSAFKVKEADVKAALAELSEYDAQLNRCTYEISVINEKKARLITAIEEQLDIYAEADSTIIEEYLNVAELHGAKLDEDFNSGALRLIQEARRQALDSLYQYQYLLIKAYECHFLTRFKGEISLAAFIEEFSKVFKKVAKQGQTLASFLEAVKGEQETLQKFLLRQTNVLYDDIKTSLMQSPRTPWQVSLPAETVEMLNVPGGRGHASVLLDLPAFRGEDLLDLHFNARIINVALAELAFVVISDDTEYSLKEFAALPGVKAGGTVNIQLLAREQGTVRRDYSTSIVLRPEAPHGWNWEYAFTKKAMSSDDLPKDEGLVLQDNTISQYLEDKPRMKKEELIAPYPMETTLNLTLTWDFKSTLNDKPVDLRLKSLAFNIHYSSMLSPMAK